MTRIRDLAPWQHVDLDLEDTALRAEIDRLEIDTVELVPLRFERHSIRQQGRTIPVAGYMGRVSVHGPLDKLLPFLALGERTNIGSHAAMGFGRYSLALYP